MIRPKTPFALIAYFAIQQVESNVITPTIVKERLSIPGWGTLHFSIGGRHALRIFRHFAGRSVAGDAYHAGAGVIRL